MCDGYGTDSWWVNVKSIRKLEVGPAQSIDIDLQARDQQRGTPHTLLLAGDTD